MQNRKSGNQTRQSVIRKRNIRLIVAFEGTAYHGWQMQKNQCTVQGTLCHAIGRLTAEKVTLTGSGRTDAGTHARALVANFHTGSRIPCVQLVRALNGLLPFDIRVLSARYATPSFHARRDARGKVYRYQIYLGPILPPHMRREYFHYPYPIDITQMKRGARLFRGEHDFASFAKGRPELPTVRRITHCELKKHGHRLSITVEGNGFLHHMVRNMSGTLLEVGRGSISLNGLKDLFIQRDRRLAGFTAPAHGLVLLKVKY